MVIEVRGGVCCLVENCLIPIALQSLFTTRGGEIDSSSMMFLLVQSYKERRQTECEG